MAKLKGTCPGNPSPARDCGVLKAQPTTGVKARIPANVLDVCLQAARRISGAACQEQGGLKEPPDEVAA